MSNSHDALAAIASPRARALSLGAPATPEAQRIRAAYWVLDGSGPVAALCARLPRLTAQLARRTSRRRVEQLQLRGRIDWPATVTARAVSGSDASLVSRIVQRSHDVLENQLLRFVVTRCLEALDRLPSAIRNGFALESIAGATSLIAIRERVELRRAALRDRQLHHRLATVALPPRIDARWIDAARNSDVRDYTLVSAAHQAWAERVDDPSWDHLMIPGDIVLVPDSRDATLWIALAARRTSPRR